VVLLTKLPAFQRVAALRPKEEEEKEELSTRVCGGLCTRAVSGARPHRRRQLGQARSGQGIDPFMLRLFNSIIQQTSEESLKK
jgi:hypothetical protein